MKTRISIAFWLIQHWMRLVFRRNNWPRTHNKYNEKRFLFLFFSCLNCHVTISPHVVRIAILKTIRVGNFSFVAFRFHVDMADPFDLACFFFVQLQPRGDSKEQIYNATLRARCTFLTNVLIWFRYEKFEEGKKTSFLSWYCLRIWQMKERCYGRYAGAGVKENWIITRCDQIVGNHLAVK